MNTATLSSKFQLGVPAAVRKAMGLKAGQKFVFITAGDRIELLPVRSAKSMRGAFPGLDTDIPREGDRL